jgi:two-component system response regulator PilR (NtrC family)
MPIKSEGRDINTMLTKKILIVDDNPNMSVLLSDILEIFDFKGSHAADGNEALDKLRRGKYDLVFTDLRMPNMDGLDLLKAIKSEHPGLPVVVVTGYSGSETRDEVLAEKADGFLSKPFKVHEIQTLLTSLLGQQL